MPNPWTVLFESIQFRIITHFVKKILIQPIQFSQTVLIQTIQFSISIVFGHIQLKVKKCSISNNPF